VSVIKRAADRIKGLVTVGRVKSAASGSAASGSAIVEGIVDDELRAIQQYGFASRPLPGAEAVVLTVGSNADEAIIIAMDDRRYRIALQAGEVALCDDEGSRVILRRGGIVEIEATEIKLGASASSGGARQGDSVTVSGDWLTWLGSVATAAGVPTSPPVTPIGSISTSSAKVKVQ